MFRHILVSLDGSPLAATTIRYAVALAHTADARIGLLAVVEPFPAHDGIPNAADQEGDERRVTESAAYLESVALPLRTRGLAVTTAVRHGNPAEAILDATEAEDCDLVVMGTHGRTGLERVRMGSVAQHVLRHAIVPSLIVPPANGNTPTGDDGAITVITVPLDGSPLAEAALPIAADIAAALSVPLTLFRVIPSIMAQAAGWGVGYEGYYPITEEMQRAEETAVTAYLAAVAAPLRAGGLTVETVWRRSVTAAADESIAAYLPATGIAVMASHGRGGVMRWVLGSTAEGVLDHAPCPILIVRADATTSGEHAGNRVHAVQGAEYAAHESQSAANAPTDVCSCNGSLKCAHHQGQDASHTDGRRHVMTSAITSQAGAATTPTDREIAAAVTNTIARDLPIPIPHLDISVHHGSVTLRGSVTDNLDGYAAENAARRTKGVQSVVNQITNIQ